MRTCGDLNPHMSGALTEEERERLEEEWLECNRQILDERISIEDYWKAVERCQEIGAILRAADNIEEIP